MRSKTNLAILLEKIVTSIRQNTNLRGNGVTEGEGTLINAEGSNRTGEGGIRITTIPCWSQEIEKRLILRYQAKLWVNAEVNQKNRQWLSKKRHWGIVTSQWVTEATKREG